MRLLQRMVGFLLRTREGTILANFADNEDPVWPVATPGETTL